MANSKAAVVAALITVTSLGGTPAVAQSPSPSESDVHPVAQGDDPCIGAMHDMMAMMRDHMGQGMMEPGPDMPAPSPGMMAPPDDGCLDFMHEMMAMMGEHLAAQTDGPSPAPSPSGHDAHHPDRTEQPGSASAANEAVRVPVRLTDELRIMPDLLTVPVGVPVTFVVTNEGAMLHEFVVGDEAVQQAHETKMQDTGSMIHDEPNAIGLAPGETKELRMVFSEPDQTLVGCHVPGHYAAGMWATIVIGS